MNARPFHPRFDDLPRILPIFPLVGALLLPGGKLPLNVFERRYLSMVLDALGQGRYIGMVQPTGAPGVGGGEAPLYATGCAGRIAAFSETEDGRIMMTLSGVCRFVVAEESAPVQGYRRILPDWEPYRDDLDDPPAEVSLDRPRLLAALRPFIQQNNLDINWKAVETASSIALVTSLPMICPFEPSEKQALLECADPAGRGRTLITLMEMAVAEKSQGRTLVRQ